MCQPQAVNYATLSPVHRRTISNAYHKETELGIKCIEQFDGSVWILAPLDTSSRRIRSAVNLRKKRAEKVYFTEFPLSALAMGSV